MYKSILVPLDGTPFSEEALPTAIRLARASHGELVIARVVDRVVPSILLTTALAGEAWVDTPADRAEQYLLDMSARIQATTGVPCRIVVLRGGIASALRKEAARIRCDLIVLSTHAHGPVGRILHSSTAGRLARSVACPVLLVRVTRGRTWNIHRRYLHVLVPLDGTPASEGAVDVACHLASLDQARITLLHVATPELAHASSAASPFGFIRMPDQVEPEDAERMSHEYLRAIAQRMQSAGTHPVIDVSIMGGDPAQEIVEYAESRGVDLIVMVTRGAVGLWRYVPGSTAASILSQGHTDVMLLPPNTKAVIA